MSGIFVFSTLITPFCVLVAYLVRGCCVLGIFYFRSTKLYFFFFFFFFFVFFFFPPKHHQTSHPLSQNLTLLSPLLL